MKNKSSSLLYPEKNIGEVLEYNTRQEMNELINVYDYETNQVDLFRTFEVRPGDSWKNLVEDFRYEHEIKPVYKAYNRKNLQNLRETVENSSLENKYSFSKLGLHKDTHQLRMEAFINRASKSKTIPRFPPEVIEKITKFGGTRRRKRYKKKNK